MVIKRLEYKDVIGIAAMEGRGFYYPVDVAVAPDDKLFVLGRSHDGDARGVQILKCDIESEYYGIFGSYGSGDGQFIWPTSIAIDSDGLIYVTDEYLNRISIFDQKCQFIKKWDSSNDQNIGLIKPAGIVKASEKISEQRDSSNDQNIELTKPAGIAIDSEKFVWIVDSQENNIKRFTPNGQCVLKFGNLGGGPGEFQMPWGIAVSDADDVYVADWGNNRIQRFTSQGAFIGEYGNNSDVSSDNLSKPSDVSVDSQGYMYVTDWGNHRLQVLSSDGELIQNFRGNAGISKWAQEFLDSNPDENIARSGADLEPDLMENDWDLHEQSYHTEKFFWSPISVENYHDDLVIVVDRNRHRMQILKINRHT